MQALNSALARRANLAPLVLRLAFGLYILWHGVRKFTSGDGISGVEGFFTGEGVPLPALTAPLVAVIEIVVGIALVIGLGTRIAAAIQALVLLGALVFVRWTPDVIPEGDGIIARSELDILFIAGFLALVFLGPGPASVDEAMKTDETVIDLRHRDQARATVDA
jgi:putative oxidoreductase